MRQGDCLFCKIIHGEIPCAKVYETEQVLAFLDIAPVTPGHCLVVPKVHAPTLLDLPPDLGGPVLEAVSRIGRAVMAATGATGFNMIANTNESAGQVVFHAHFHVIGRTSGDGLPPWPGTPYDRNETLTRLAEEIRRRAHQV
jgi:histidine triad (HIT) family protein